MHSNYIENFFTTYILHMKASHRLFAIGLVLAGLMTTAIATAQTADEPLRYVDALQFRIINKGFANNEKNFQRLQK